MACPETTFNAIGFVTELFGHSPSAFKETRGKVTRSPKKSSQDGILWERGLEWELLALILDSRSNQTKIKAFRPYTPVEERFAMNVFNARNELVCQ
jgi:hypothetical protein